MDVSLINVDYVIEAKIREMLLELLIHSGKFVRISVFLLNKFLLIASNGGDLEFLTTHDIRGKLKMNLGGSRGTQKL
jgi:hypothetical protein